MMRLPPFLQVVLVIIRIPFYLLIHVLSNVAKYAAPRTTFELAMEIFDKVKVRNYTEKIKGVDDVDFLFSWDIKQFFLESAINDAMKAARLGSEAPNPTVLNLTSSQLTPLLSLAKQGRPMILNFGSCT